MKKTILILVLVILSRHSSFSAEKEPRPMDESQVQRLLMPNAWADWVPDAAAMRDFVDAWTSRGLNGCGLQIPWNRIEPEPEQFVWDWLDERLDIIAEAGLRVHLRLATQNHRPEWVDAELMRDPNGKIAGEKHWNMLSFADDRTGRYVSRALRSIMEHAHDRYVDVSPDLVVCILPQFSGPAETEYCHDRWSDFSAPAQRDFQEWLKKRHGSIDELNDRYMTRYGDWPQVTLQNAHTYDFNVYRTERLADLIRQCADAVHSAAGPKMGVQFGSIWDGISVLRGTRDARALIEHADWVVVDDYPLYDHALSMDVLRGQAWDKMWGNEVDGPGIVSDDRGLEQCMTSLDHGARFMWVANWPAKFIRDPKWTFWEKVMEEMEKPYRDVRPKSAIVLSLATVYRERPGHGMDEYFHGLWKELSENGKVSIDIICDTVALEHPERLAQYTEGIHVPGTMLWMTEELFDALQRSPVLVYADSSRVGIMNEYGHPRLERAENWGRP